MVVHHVLLGGRKACSTRKRKFRRQESFLPSSALNNVESKEEKPITCFTPEDAFIARLDIGGCQLASLDVYKSGHYRDHRLYCTRKM
jgi:hypothetical protein